MIDQLAKTRTSGVSLHQSVCVVIASTWNHNQLLRCFPVLAATGKARLEQLTEALRSPAVEGPAVHMHPVEFEKVSRRILFCTQRTFQTPQRHSDDRTSGDRRSRSAVPGPSSCFLGCFFFGFLGFSVTQICVWPSNRFL